MILIGLCFLESCVFELVGSVLSLGRECTSLAFLTGGSAGVLTWKGWSEVSEVTGDRIVVRSKSKLYHAIQYGLGMSACGLALLIEVTIRGNGVSVPWTLPFESLMVVGMPFGALAAFVVSGRVARWIGIGA